MTRSKGLFHGNTGFSALAFPEIKSGNIHTGILDGILGI